MRSRQALWIVLLVAVSALWLGCRSSSEASSPKATIAASESTALATQTSTTRHDSTTGTTVFARATGPRFAPDSLAELEADSDAICVVEVLDSEQRLSSVQESDNPSPIPVGSTRTKVLVEKVRKADGRLAQGSTYAVVEQNTRKDSPDGANTYIFALGNVVPMSLGARYLLFLDRSSRDDADYEIHGIWYGKYWISEEIKKVSGFNFVSKEMLEAAEDAEGDPAYWRLAEEVWNKYLKGGELTSTGG